MCNCRSGRCRVGAVHRFSSGASRRHAVAADTLPGATRHRACRQHAASPYRRADAQADTRPSSTKPTNTVDTAASACSGHGAARRVSASAITPRAQCRRFSRRRLSARAAALFGLDNLRHKRLSVRSLGKVTAGPPDLESQCLVGFALEPRS
jgi:hypothetical protein